MRWACRTYSSIARGVESADQMLKTADVQALFMRTICPGKYLAAVHGNIAAVNAAVEAGKTAGGTELIDGFTLANVHQQVLPALSGSVVAEDLNALGILETYSATAIVLAPGRRLCPPPAKPY